MSKMPEVKLEELTPAARQAVETKSLNGGWDGRGLVRLFADLERWDDMAEARKSRATKLIIWAVVLMGVGFFATVITSAIMDDFIWQMLLLLAGGLALLIVGIRKKKAAKAIDLPNEIRISLRPLLRKLKQDLHPDEKVRVAMNLSGIDERTPHEAKNLPPGRNKHLMQKTYHEKIGSLRLPLADGSVATIRLENTYLKHERTYRTSRGKTKSKSKWKKLATVSTMLVPPSRISWESGRLQGIIDKQNERVSFVEKDGVLAARLDRYYKFKSADGPPAEAAPAADIIRMLVRLNTVRPQAAGGAQ